ncbi:MAG: phasin family protein [Pseudomonadota bacterium]
MVKIPEQINEISKSNVEMALKFAKISMDSAEKLVKLQIEAARAAMEENAKSAKALAETKDLQAANALRMKLAESGVEQAMAYAKSVYDVTTHTQGELARLFEERLQSLTKGMSGAFDQATASAPPGADFAVNAMRSAMAASQAAMDAMTKAGKQMTEMAQANFRTAASATTDAVKKTTGGGKKGS